MDECIKIENLLKIISLGVFVETCVFIQFSSAVGGCMGGCYLQCVDLCS